MANNSEIIGLERVTKSYGNVPALKGVDMTVKAGDLFGFLGPNGAGKTTTIRILTGFIRAGGGSARVFGLDAWRDSVALKRRTGFLPDTPAVYGGLTGREYLDHLAHLRGYRQPPALQRELLDRLEMPEAALKRALKGYSQGMKQKVMLIQAMQHDPELLIMDEPTDALDPLMRHVFFSLVHEFHGRGGTVFVSSHVLSDVEAVCDRVAIIRDGVIVSTGNVNELRKRYTRTMWVEFQTAPPAGIEAPGVSVISREGNLWRLAVAGDINPLLRELASYDLADLVFERLSLEEMFLEHYRQEAPARWLASLPGPYGGTAPASG